VGVTVGSILVGVGVGRVVGVDGSRVGLSVAVTAGALACGVAIAAVSYRRRSMSTKKAPDKVITNRMKV
jgi:hypothetical protein